MPAGHALLKAIQQDPDNDPLRLAYADWLDEHGDPARAELIRVQIEAERHPHGSPEHTRLTDRAIELLREHGFRWSRGYESAVPADADMLVYRAESRHEYGIVVLNGRRTSISGGLSSALSFRRGFLEAISFSPEKFFSLGGSDLRLVGPLPIFHLNVDLGALEDYVGRLPSSPLLACCRDLRIDAGFGAATATGLQLLANEPALLARLGGLGMSENLVGDAGLLPILESPHLTGLCQLMIDSTKCTEATLQALLRSDRFRGMTHLNLGSITRHGRGLRLFATPGRWPRLRALWLWSCGLEDLTLRGLVRPGAFPSLELLDLAFNQVHFPAVRALLKSGAFPKLRTLGIGGAPLTLDEVQDLRTEFGHRVEIFFPVPRSHSAANTDLPSAPVAPSP